MESNGILKKSLCIIYHSPCYDGTFGAINAYLYYKNFKNEKYNITFKPQKKNVPIFTFIDKKYNKIISIDLCLKDEDINFILDSNNMESSIIIFDHHFSWFEKYNAEFKIKLKDRKKLKIILDEKNIKSACGLSFDYYKNKSLSKKNNCINAENIFNDKLKEINLMIEDADTGNYKLKFSEEFKAGLLQKYPLKTTDLTYKTYERIKNFTDITTSYLIGIGDKSLKKIKKQAINILKTNPIYIVELKNNNKFLMCISEDKYVRNFAGPILGKISHKKGFMPVGAFVFSISKGLYEFSMRTTDESCDVSKIANMYGGGGHKKAAAFNLESNNINKLIIQQLDILKDIESISL